MKRFYCNGKKGICPYANDCNVMCGNCEHYNGEGGAVIEVEPTESEDTE